MVFENTNSNISRYSKWLIQLRRGISKNDYNKTKTTLNHRYIHSRSIFRTRCMGCNNNHTNKHQDNSMHEREGPKSNIYRARCRRPFRRMCFAVSIRSYCSTCTWYKQFVILGWYHNSSSSYRLDSTWLVYW